MSARTVTTRRRLLALGIGAPLGLIVARTAGATPESMQAAIDTFTEGTVPEEARVALDIPLLVENGNTVPMMVSVESPMTADDHVTTIAVFNEANPLPEVAVFHLTPSLGRAEVQTRIRLSDTQTITAIARTSDGRLWSANTSVIVTAPACAEE